MTVVSVVVGFMAFLFLRFLLFLDMLNLPERMLKLMARE